MKPQKPTPGDLCVWWIPQVPMEPFWVPVQNLQEAMLLLRTLADYDRFQFENNIKPDYSNTGGLVVWEAVGENGEWTEWEDEEGRQIDELLP